MIREVCILTGERNAVTVWEENGEAWYLADGDIDADGANGQKSGRGAYHPRDIGLDWLANAGYPNRPDNYKDILVLGHNGTPIIQGPEDPAPGYFISKTSYRFPDKLLSDPKAYLDAETVDFIVVSPRLQNGVAGVVLGCRARVTNTRTGKAWDCIVGDIGPRNKIGELSISLAKKLGIDPSPKDGGTDELILKYQVWPGQHGSIDGQLLALLTAKGRFIFPDGKQNIA